MKKKKRKSTAPSHDGGGDSDDKEGVDVPVLSQPHSDTAASEQEHVAPEASAESAGVLADDANECATSINVEQAVNDQLEICSPKEAARILERFFAVLVMASLAVHVTLKPLCGQNISMEKLEDLLHQAGLKAEFLPIERKAFRSLTASSDQAHENAVHVQLMYDQASAIAFRAEMCELQIRAAVLKNGAGSKSSKAKLDVQRVIMKLVSHLPTEPSATITSAQFETILEEKLGLIPGSFLVKIVFARIIKRPFQRSFPRVLEESRATFCEALEQFCVHKPLSLDSVEGQLRHLVINHPDLRQTFQTMDLDGSGSISMLEFIVFLQREAQMHFPDDVLKAFIKRFDIDGDETLNYEEFIEFVRPKQFGINVLTPFGLFYLTVDRLEKMGGVVEKIKTRMFWLQHNELFAVASAASSAYATAAATRTAKSFGAPARLKVTDRFILTHHFGALRLEFQANDPIMSVLANGELVVLVLCKDEHTSTMTARSDEGGRVDSSQRSLLLLPFEYRLKPTTKRNLPPLFSTTEMLQQQGLRQQQQASSLEVTATRSANTRKLSAVSVQKLSASRRPSIASNTSSRSSSSSSSMQTRTHAAPSIQHMIAALHSSSKVTGCQEHEDVRERDNDESSTSSSRNAESAHSAPAFPSLSPPFASIIEKDGRIEPHMSQSIVSEHEECDDDDFDCCFAGDEGAPLAAATHQHPQQHQPSPSSSSPPVGPPVEEDPLPPY